MSPAEKLIALVFVTSFMVQTGLAIPKGSLAHAAGRGREIVSGVLLMLVIGPVVALLVARGFRLEGPAGAALVVLAVSGVVPLASRGAKTARGDVPLALLLMLLLSLVSVFTAAPSTRVLLAYWGPLDIKPGAFIFQLIFLQALPLGVGLLLRSRAERLATLEKVLSAVNIVAFLALAALVMAPHLGAIKTLGLRGAAATVVFAAIMAALGWVIGGPTLGGRRTIAAVANMPNAALALALVASADAPPVLSVSVLGIFFLRIIVGAIVQLVLARRAKPAATQAPRAESAGAT